MRAGEATTMRRSYAEFLAVKAVARALAQVRADEWTPRAVEQQRERAVVVSHAELWGGAGLKGRTPSQAVVCPARMTARHPDQELRRLGREQADESHAIWGPCCPCRKGFVPARTVTPKNKK